MKTFTDAAGRQVDDVLAPGRYQVCGAAAGARSDCCITDHRLRITPSLPHLPRCWLAGLCEEA